MDALHDLVLERPLGATAGQVLLFAVFALHILFVLLTLGTALIGVVSLLRGHLDRQADPIRRFGGSVLQTFFAHKSLAIVFGVGPLLLMASLHSVPFLTAANLLAPLWISIIVLLSSSLLIIEYVNHRGRSRPHLTRRDLAAGLLGLSLLFTVPAVFVSVVVLTENPGSWERALLQGGRLPSELLAHALFRYLHVLGAAVALAAGYRYLFAKRDAEPEVLRRLRGWIFGALLFQVVVGVLLLATLSTRIPGVVLVVLGVGVALTAATLAWTWYTRPQARRSALAVALLGSLLLVMLLVRQSLQDRTLIPLQTELARRAEPVVEQLAAQAGRARSKYSAVLSTPYREPATIYERSCAMCHGGVGNGEGEEAPYLLVAPEDLTRLRMRDGDLRQVLTDGVDGTGMPRFDYYTRCELEGLVAFLRESIGLRREVEGSGAEVSEADESEADRIYRLRCSVCHGRVGQTTGLSRGFRPAPPDLRVLTVSSDRAFQIVSEGYPQTMMPAFGALPEGTRRALVERVHDLYGTQPSASPTPSGPAAAPGSGAPRP